MDFTVLEVVLMIIIFSIVVLVGVAVVVFLKGVFKQIEEAMGKM